jgi:GAF domain-containing protein
MTPQAEDAARLQQLLGDADVDRAPLDATKSAVLDVILARMRCRRVSMWRFDGSGSDLSLLCFASKTADGVFDTSERRLRRAEFIAYFNGLVGSGTYVSVDAMNDPLLQPMRESYLVANNVVSMLDAAFVLNNRTYGMVCCEEPHRREWTPGDVMALRAIVNKIALLMWNAPDSVLLRRPSLPLRVIVDEPAHASPASPRDRRH